MSQDLGKNMRFRGLAVVVLLLSTFMELLDTTIVNVALPAIEADLNGTSAQLEWIVSGYVLAFAVLVITGGRLGDIYGRKRIFIIGLIGFTVSSATCAFASTADVLVISRLIQGVFGALMIPQTLSIIQVLFKPKERAGVFAAFGLTSGLAAVAGPLLGGYLVTNDPFGVGWRSIFSINIPVGIALIIAAFIFIPESKAKEKVKLDVLGVALISSSLLLLVFALIEGRSWGWPIGIWLMIAASPVLLAIFIWQQKKRDAETGSALVPPSLFRSRGYSAGVIVQFAFGGAIGTFFLILAIYLQTGLGFSAFDAGFATLPFSVGAFFGSGASISLVARFGKYLILAGTLIMMTGYVWIIQLVISQGDQLVGSDLIAAMAISGIGLSFLIVPLNDVALAQTSSSNAGAASGVLGSFNQVGGALGVAIIGVVFFGVINDIYTSAVVRDAFVTGMWVPIGSLILGAIASLLLPSIKQVAANKVEAELIEAE
jgi:EmrB/QacA subfamily drug resistance transporter